MSSDLSNPIPALNESSHTDSLGLASPTPSSHGSISSQEDSSVRLSRPKLGSRKSSGTMIVSKDSPQLQLSAEQQSFDPDDVRSMSPRRSMEAIDKLGEDARQQLIDQAKQLQESLLAIVGRVEQAKEEHEKLEGGNKFLQSYIGELIQTTKNASAGKSKGKGRG